MARTDGRPELPFHKRRSMRNALFRDAASAVNAPSQ
jgi:hypothetical protein